MSGDSSQLVADLTWAVESPSFVCGDNAEAPGSIDASAVDADHLAAFVGEPPRRVGQYFERLMHYWLQHVRGVEMLGSGVQVLDGKRTVGEIDFLFTDESAQLNHWEVAVKFFLYHPDRQGSHFPGPNARDDFERKATKIFGPQLGLSEMSHPEVTVRRALVKGMAFYHPDVDPPAELPDRMPADHQRATWIRSDQLDSLSERWPDAVGAVLEKPHWLAVPAVSAMAPIGDVQNQLMDRFTHLQRPTMVALCDAAGHEITRLCVVSPAWDSAQRQAIHPPRT